MVIEIKRVNCLINLIKCTGSKGPVLKEEFKTAKAFAGKSLCSFVDTSVRWECHDFTQEHEFKKQKSNNQRNVCSNSHSEIFLFAGKYLFCVKMYKFRSYAKATHHSNATLEWEFL